jgi:hypothetical protein
MLMSPNWIERLLIGNVRTFTTRDMVFLLTSRIGKLSIDHLNARYPSLLLRPPVRVVTPMVFASQNV